MLDTLFYLKLYGAETFLIETKKKNSKKKSLCVLNNLTGWAYSYIIPSNQTKNENTVIVVGFVEPDMPKVLHVLFEEFNLISVVGDKTQILNNFVSNINFDKLDLTEHECEWIDQILVGELLDTYLAFSEKDIPENWKCPLAISGLKKNWEVIDMNYNLWKTHIVERIARKSVKELLLEDTTSIYNDVWKHSLFK